MGRNRLTFPLLCPLLLLIVTLIQLADTGVQHTSEGKHGKQKKAHGGVASILHAAGMEVRKRAKKKTAESDAKRMKKKQKLKQQKMRLGMKRHHGAEADSGLVSIFRRGISNSAVKHLLEVYGIEVACVDCLRKLLAQAHRLNHIEENLHFSGKRSPYPEP